jgi:hypothetical protein
MSEYDRSEKYSVIKRGLKKLGLEYKNAGKHDTATVVDNGRKTTVPRAKQLNKYTVGSIVDFLKENEFSDEEIKKAFKWK